MTRDDQHRVAKEILSRISEVVRERIDRIPAEWDGIEIRQWIADTVQDQFAYRMTASRKRAYTNARITENL